MVRSKGGIPKSRILNDPNFARTRENMSEFAHCAKAGQTLRIAIRNLLRRAKDGRVSARLSKLMHELKRMDTISPRGQRKVYVGLQTPANREIMKGFEFNANSKFHSMFHADFSIDETTDTLSFTGFNPANDVVLSPDATHMSLTFAKADINFENDEKYLAVSETWNMPVTDTVSDHILTAELSEGSGLSMYLILVEFFQEVNGTQYPLHNGAFNMLSIVKVM